MKGLTIIAGFIFLFITAFYSYALDMDILSKMLKDEIKKTSINRDVIIGQIKFIGFEPKQSCIPEGLKIREIKRPSAVEFTFTCAQKPYRAIANFEILTTIYITQRPILRGQTINEGDIIEIKQSVNRIPAGAITDKNNIIGRVLKRTLAQGLIIKEEHLYSGIPVKRGSRVNIIINTGKVTIMTDGVLKSDATVGENATVICNQTGKEIVGKLIDKDKVRLVL